MTMQLRKSFLLAAALPVLFAASALASHHHSLNGTWTLIPERSDFAGGRVITSAAITINDRQHNIYISRNFTSEGDNTITNFTFVTDGREKSTIYKPDFQSKAKWDGDVLRVTTRRANGVETESYSLQPEGTLLLLINSPDGRALSLTFRRQ